MKHSSTLAAFLAAAVGLSAPLEGQPPRPHDPPLATLSVWAERVWVSLLDRDGAYSGRLAEEGVFQRFHPLMDDEYELDVLTGLFTPGEDARWAGRSNGLRAAGASVSHPHVLNVIDWRQEVPVAGRVDVPVRYRRERSLTARRDYPRVGVRWRDVLGSPWTVEGALGVHFFKPSADVELTVGRTWEGDGEDGARWHAEAGVAALDAFSNTIFNALGVREGDVEAHLDYRTPARAARISLRRSSPLWLVEVHGGASNRSEVRVTFPSSGRAPFSQRERVSFAGVLVQASPTGRLSLALYGTAARADTERRFAPSRPEGFALREETARLGMRQRVRLTSATSLEGDLERVWRPERRTPRQGPDVDHRDRATFGRVALVRRPTAGWTGRLAYSTLDRRAGSLAPHLTAHNHRLVTAWGWLFLSGFEVTAGLRWDLDAFRRGAFDGGHLRLAGRW